MEGEKVGKIIIFNINTFYKNYIFYKKIRIIKKNLLIYTY